MVTESVYSGTKTKENEQANLSLLTESQWTLMGTSTWPKSPIQSVAHIWILLENYEVFLNTATYSNSQYNRGTDGLNYRAFGIVGD